MSTEQITHKVIEETCEGRHTKVYTVTDIKTGTTVVVLSRTIIERYPIQQFDYVMALFEDLTDDNGKREISLAEMTGVK